MTSLSIVPDQQDRAHDILGYGWPSDPLGDTHLDDLAAIVEGNPVEGVEAALREVVDVVVRLDSGEAHLHADRPGKSRVAMPGGLLEPEPLLPLTRGRRG